METEAVWRPFTSKEVPSKANESLHRSLVIVEMPKVVAPIVTFPQRVVTAMTNNLDGAATARNDKKAALVTLQQQLRT